MKKYFILTTLLAVGVCAYAFDMYAPRESSSTKTAPQVIKTEQQQEMREIKNLNEYFRYLPKQVHRNWIPYKANAGYEVTVQFKVNKDGSISDTKIVNSTNPNANISVLNAVKNGAPYQPLPKSYTSDSVTAQVVLEYRK